jgi:hypothetical protein
VPEDHHQEDNHHQLLLRNLEELKLFLEVLLVVKQHLINLILLSAAVAVDIMVEVVVALLMEHLIVEVVVDLDI